MKRRNAMVGRWLALAGAVTVLVALTGRPAQAQMYGFGYGGYGMAGPYYGGFAYGYPAVVYGMPYPRYGFGYGFGGYGYSNPGFGYTYGYPGMGYSGMGYGYGNFPYVPTSTFSGAPNINPLFGVGLSPLGVSSALTERNMLGRGTGSLYDRSYAPGGYSPSNSPFRPSLSGPR